MLSILFNLFPTAGLMNTGLGLAGSLDPNWKVISVPSGTTNFVAGSNAYIMTPELNNWSSSSSWPSKWIGITNDGDYPVLGGTYIFQLSFASASYYSSTSGVDVFFLVDEALTSVAVLDGNSTIQTITAFSGGGFKCFGSFSLTTFGPIITVLTFTVVNGGLLVQFGEYEYIATCPTPAPTC